MRSLLLASGAAIVAAFIAFGCGTVTGLSDDFKFVDDAAAADGASSSSGGTDAGGDVAADAKKDSGQPTCSVSQTMQASTAIADNNGDNLPAQCVLCLSTSCCAEIIDCNAKTSTCRQALSCVFSCQQRSGGERQACVNQCSNVSTLGDVFACDMSSCTSTCGSLTK